MAGKIKIKAKSEGDIVSVKTLMDHPMETGTRKDENTGELVAAHYIQEVTAEVNGKIVFMVNMGTGVSRNPYLAFKFKGAKTGDVIKISWTDNKGESASGEAEIK